VPLFRGSISHLRSNIDNGSLVPTLSEQYRHRLGRSAPPAEVRSWERSLDVLSRDLSEVGLHEVEALVEYQLPLTSKRADVVLCGVHPRSGLPQFLVVELKQWSRAHMVEDAEDLCALDGMGTRLHPVEQVRRYCTHIRDFVAALAEEDTSSIAGVAYLHNATDIDLADLWMSPQDDWGRMYTGQRRGEFLTYLRQILAPTSGAASADLLMGSAIRPSKQLLSLAAEEVQRREQFVLLDEQQVAYSLVMRAVEQSHRSNTKEVIIVSGGPGSGKSVIALSLLGDLSRRGRSMLHATGSSAFTQTLRRVAGARAPRVRGMFKYFIQFVNAERNGLDVLICDEAHRIRETSANRYTTASLRSGRPQVSELIDAARVPGSEARRTVPLRRQPRVRTMGSQALGACAWRPGAVVLDEGFSARMAAGYCWPWSDPVPGGGLKPDVQIGDWHKPWNNKKDTSHGGAPGTPYWASDAAGFEQVGCVYTAQGFEYDYAGVIMGPDLVWRSDRWVPQPAHSHDSQVKRGTPSQFDEAIRNTYKVLLTRGMRGTVVYSTDAESQELLQSLIPASAPS
jgi:hypothetical protein